MARSRAAKPASARGRGRPKGSRNRVTNEVKDAILEVFERLGGVDAMMEWVLADDANKAIFYGRIIPRLLPRPAPEPPPEPEAPPPVTGALVWKEPEWARKAKRALRAKTAARAAASAATAQGRPAAEPWNGETGPPGDGDGP